MPTVKTIKKHTKISSLIFSAPISSVLESHPDKPKVEKFLEKITNINSKTDYKEGIDCVVDEIIKVLHRHDVLFERHPHSTAGDLLVAHYHTDPKLPKIIFSVHSDIVVPKDQHQKFSYNRKEGKFYGTGINDMKGGITVALFSLLEFVKNEIPANITLVVTPDEEIGSFAHEKILGKLYATHDLGMVFEATRALHQLELENTMCLVTSRKGVIDYKMTAYGVNDHSGTTMHKKDRKSAIHDLIYKSVKLIELEDYSKGTTVNIGAFNGGFSRNTISDEAKILVDFRFETEAELNRILNSIKKIAKKADVAGVTVKEGDVHYSAPMEYTPERKAFYKFVKKVGKGLGLEIVKEHRGGASDANVMQQYGLTALDGFGTRGDGCHNPESYIYKKSLYQSMDLVTAVVHALNCHVTDRTFQ